MIKRKMIILTALVLIMVGALGGLLAWLGGNRPLDVADVKTFAQEITGIAIDSDNVGVEVRSTADTKIKVELMGSAFKNTTYNFDASVEHGLLSITAAKTKQSWFNLVPIDLNIVISLPEKQYHSLQVDGNSGMIQLEGLQIDEIYCNTEISDIALETITAKDITLESGAHIGLSDVTSECLTAKTSASITMEAIEVDSIVVKTGAQITLSTSHIDRNIHLESSHGSIQVRTGQAPENVRFEISTKSTINLLGGRYYNGVDVGDGDNLVRLVAAGSITVEGK